MTPAVSAYHPTPAPPASFPSQPPPAEPVPTMQPPPPSSDATAGPAPSNPLKRRGRAVDPSIAAGGGYGGGYGGGQYGHHQPQPPMGDPYNSGGYQAPAYTEAPSQPHFFTPDSGAAASALAPPPATHHMPDQPGPGFTPAVSNGSGWNDPPPMMTKAAPSLAATNTTPALSSDPITQPLFGSTAVQEPAPAPTWGGFQPAPVQAETSYHHQTPAGFAGFQPADPPPVNQPPAPAPATAAPPAPIPAEHQVIQDTTYH